jgi:hypothetical protein
MDSPAGQAILGRLLTAPKYVAHFGGKSTREFLVQELYDSAVDSPICRAVAMAGREPSAKIRKVEGW